MASLSQQQSVGQQFQASIYAIVQEVMAAGGARKAYASTLAFQQLWNENQPLLSGAGILWFKLDEDGKWGVNTAKAVKLLTARETPLHTEGLIPWYKQNKDLIDSFANAGPAPQVQQPMPQAPAPAWVPSAANMQVVNDLHGAVYLLAQEVASAQGAGKPYPSILLFQQLWDRAVTKQTVNTFYAHGIVGRKWFRLARDGKYGKYTGLALSMTTSTATPAKTYGLVAWYAANRDLIDGWADAARNLAGSRAPSIIDSAKLTPDPAAVSAAAQAVADSARNGSLAQSQVPDQQAQSTPQGQLVSQYSPSSVANQDQHASVGGDSIGSYPPSNQGVSQQQVTPPQAIDSKIAVANEISKVAPSIGQSEAITFADEPVIAQKPRTNLTVWAVGAGLLAAAGVFAYMAKNPSARRRFA